LGVQKESQFVMVKASKPNQIKGFSSLATLHKNRLLFNSNITVSHSGGNLFSEFGLILVKEFMYTINFSNSLKQNITITDDRLYYK